jgi:hypothetical protein
LQTISFRFGVLRVGIAVTHLVLGIVLSCRKMRAAQPEFPKLMAVRAIPANVRFPPIQDIGGLGLLPT